MKLEKLVSSVKKHEGFRSLPYNDSLGVLTIGYGFNLRDVGLSEDESSIILSLRLTALHNKLKDLDLFSYNNLPNNAKEVLIEMAYQLGISGVKKFKNFGSFLKKKDFYKAAEEMRDSLWYKQTPNRVENLIKNLCENK